MPELPEVESYRRLADLALDRPIAMVVAPDAWFLKGATTPELLHDLLVGRSLQAARRIGKLLLLDTDLGAVIGIRFGMTGTLLVDGSAGVDRLLYAPRRREDVWERFGVHFKDGGSLVVHDPRRLGGVTVDPDTSRLGPDALAITLDQLSGALRGVLSLKARLLDQSSVAGVGNLIGDEVLWRAALSPVRPANSLSPAETRRLHRCLGQTLADLIERGGSHTGDLMPERHPGGHCPKDGAELVRSTVGGRTTWWCPQHQR